MSEFAAGNVFIRPNFMNEGDVIHGHAHTFDHVSYVISGAVRLVVRGQDGKPVTRIVHASDRVNWILIRAGVEHEITALMPDTRFHCIYAHRTPQGEVVQEYSGWEGAYV